MKQKKQKRMDYIEFLIVSKNIAISTLNNHEVFFINLYFDRNFLPYQEIMKTHADMTRLLVKEGGP